MARETLNLRSLFETNKDLMFEHHLRTSFFANYQLYITFRDDFIDEINDTVPHSADWYELIQRVYAAQDWDKLRMEDKRKMEDMKMKNAGLIKKVNELEGLILELSLSPDPGPLFMQARANYNKSLVQLNSQKIDSKVRQKCKQNVDLSSI